MLTFMYGEARVITKCKKLCSSVFSISVLMSAMVTTADASYLPNAGELSPNAGEFTYFPTPTAWDPGANTARVGGFPAAGGATWSIMAAGLSDVFGIDPHGGASTSDISSLGFTQTTIESIIDAAMDTWAVVSGFTNLGQVADGNVGFGALEANGGHLGDIRIGAINFDGPFGVLAHAYQPGTESIFGTGGTITGDMHIDNQEDWVGSFDLASVILHELGHSLGLGHSADVNAIMFPTYSGVNVTLGADDIAGIQSIYGAAVPLPGAAFLFMSGIGALGFFGRKQIRV